MGPGGPSGRAPERLIGERFLARPPEPEEGLNTADRFLVTVHAPAEALPEYARIDPEDPSEFEDGAVAAPESVRRLCCDAAVVRRADGGETRLDNLVSLCRFF